jgi:hypothetical protein
MRTGVRRIRWRGVAARHRDAAELLHDAGDVVLVERGRPRHLIVRCPCGCGDDISLNVDPEAGPCWRLLRRGDNLTVMPSVWRETGCESHFFLWRDEVDWLDWYNYGVSDVDEALRERVARALKADEFRSVHELAFEADGSLHGVHRACQQLVEADRAIEGTGRERGMFCARAARASAESRMRDR